MNDKFLNYYGFDTTPFGKTIPTGDLHPHGHQQEAIARLTWCIAERGIGVLTGEVGAGKSVAARATIASLDTSRHAIIYVGNPAIGSTGIYAAITSSLGAVPRHHKYALIPQTAELLATENTERGRLPVLVIDEAHLLTNTQLEDLRLLTNTEMDSESPLAVLLIGQPTLRRRIKLGVFAALDQRITTRCHIDGMNLPDTKTYLSHRLRLAGRNDPLFSDSATALIHKHSRGRPRAINNLGLNSLIAAYGAKKSMVDPEAVNQAIADITDE